MAGRGVLIRIEVIGGATSGIISLPVALHSPLEVLREQLQELTNIPIADQVLILCNLEDRERNSDVLLDGRDHLSLRQCGISNGSFLTLHPLGQHAQNNMRFNSEQLASAGSVTTSNEAVNKPTSTGLSTLRSPRSIAPSFDDLPPLVVESRINAANADHSYNGIIFDVVNKGPYEIQLNSISLGGMLGRLRIFVRDRPWNVDNEDTTPTAHWWAHRDSISTLGWRMIVDRLVLPSWDRHCEIVFDVPIIILPHRRHGIYCHSSLPDDLGE